MLFFMLIFSANYIYAQPFLPLIEKIITQDESINSSKFLVKKARNDLSSTTSLYTPKIDLTMPFGREVLINNDASNTNLDFYEFNAKVTQNIYDFGLTSSKFEKAENKLKLAEVSQRNVKINKIYEALAAYLNYIKAYKILEFSKQSEARIREVSNLENEKVSRGAGLASNVLQSKAKLAGAKSTRVKFQGDLEVTRNRFFNVFRELPKSFNTFKVPNLPLSLLPSSEQEAIQIAKKNNISLKLSSINLDNAKSSIKTSKAKFFPSLKASAEYKNKRNMSGLDGTEIDHIYKIEMKYPISIGGPYGFFYKENSDYKSSMNQYMMAKYSHDQMERNLEESVRNAWQTKKSSKENYEFLENQANISGEFFDIAMKEVKLGNRQLIDILSSETAYINAKSAAEVAYTDYQLATYQLLLSVGILDEDIFRNPKTIKKSNINIKSDNKTKISKIVKVNNKNIIFKDNSKTKLKHNYNEKVLKKIKKENTTTNITTSKKLSKAKSKDDNKKLDKPITIINEKEFLLDSNISINKEENKKNIKYKELDNGKSDNLVIVENFNNTHKVQLGAFSNFKNANNLMDKINSEKVNEVLLNIKHDKNNYFKILSINNFTKVNAKKICKQFASNKYSCIILKK